MKFNPQHWPQRLYFEVERLPRFAISLDLLGTYHLPGLPEETSLWLWHFSICVGKVVQDSSSNVQRHAGQALETMKQSERTILEKLTLSFPNHDARTIYDNWITSLKTMIEVARGRETCRWIAGAEDDRQFMLKYTEASPTSENRNEQ